jgi:hypothetical protein
VRSRASSFKWQYPLLSLRSSSSFLRLLPRLLVTRSHYVEESFWRRLSTCRQTEYWMNEYKRTLHGLIYDSSLQIQQFSKMSNVTIFKLPVWASQHPELKLKIIRTLYFKGTKKCSWVYESDINTL